MAETVLVCGSRVWNDGYTIHKVIAALPPGTIVVHGGAAGADTLAGIEAQACGLEVRVYRADWNRHGKAAGPIRNQQMIDMEHPDRVIAFRVAGRSPGTDDMVRRSDRRKIPVEVHHPEPVANAITRIMARHPAHGEAPDHEA